MEDFSIRAFRPSATVPDTRQHARFDLPCPERDRRLAMMTGQEEQPKHPRPRRVTVKECCQCGKRKKVTRKELLRLGWIFNNRRRVYCCPACRDTRSPGG